MSKVHSQYGFTIVELLIVIIVIGILAAITVVAFGGIKARAVESQKATKLMQVKKSLDSFQIINGYYPNNTEIGGASGAALIGLTLKDVTPSDAPDQNLGIVGQSWGGSSSYYISYMATPYTDGSGFQCNSGQCQAYTLTYYDRVANQAVIVRNPGHRGY